MLEIVEVRVGAAFASYTVRLQSKLNRFEFEMLLNLNIALIIACCSITTRSLKVSYNDYNG